MFISEQNEKIVIKKIAKELLEYRLGIEATDENIEELANHIIEFENETYALKKLGKVN